MCQNAELKNNTCTSRFFSHCIFDASEDVVDMFVDIHEQMQQKFGPVLFSDLSV